MALSFGKGKQPKAASQDQIMSLCRTESLDYLIKPMIETGLSLDAAKDVVAEANNVRDVTAACLPTDQRGASQIADKFIAAAYGGNGSFSQALRSFAVDLTAEINGDEIDHHPPPNSTGSAFDPSELYKDQ